MARQHQLGEPLTDEIDTRNRLIRAHYARDGNISLTLPGKNLSRIDTFLQRRCAPDLLALEIYPDAKEITEAEAMRRAAVTKLKMSPNREDTTAVVVGDGRHPRLGALLAFTTAWQVISIDPLAKRTTEELAMRLRPARIDRLHIIKAFVQNVTRLDWPGGTPKSVALFAPHSHGRLQWGVDLIARSINPSHLAEWNAIAMPCCEKQNLDDMTCHARYLDLGCWSAHGSIQLWRNLHHLLGRAHAEENNNS